MNNLFKFLLSIFFFCLVQFRGTAQIKILFDATKAEVAGNADWVIDADNNNLGLSTGPALLNAGNESNAQRIPTPAQSGITATTAETYWKGALSFWAVDCVKRGYTVESLPYNGVITYGDASNPQDLSNYKAYIVCEPNILFTMAEKNAILDYVSNGGSLFMIADHNVSDRNNDSFDSPHIWNDLMQNNGTGNNNPFGFIFDYDTFSETSTKLSAALSSNDSIVHGPMGNVTTLKFSAGTTMTIYPTLNASVKPVFYRNIVASGTGNTKVMVTYSRYGEGKVVSIGDSSPCDDGTGDLSDQLYTGYFGDVSPNHQLLLMNSTIWLVTDDHHVYVFTGNGDWSVPGNWKNNKIPPPTLPAGDAIIIDHTAGGECNLNVTQHIAAGATLTVNSGKNLIVPGLLQLL